MAVAKDMKSGTWFFCFQHKGKIVWKNSFRTERDGEEAELEKKIELGLLTPLDYVKFTLYEASNNIDMIFPALAKKLRRSYEIISQKKWVPDHLRGFLKN